MIEFMPRLIATVFVFAGSLLLFAQQFSSDLFAGLKWRLIGPFRGGRSVAVSGVPGGGATFYFGGVDGGIWKTDDAGTVWTPIFENQPVGSIGAIDVAPSDPNVIYAGTGESDIRSDLASGDGMYKSTDAGKTWKNIGLKETRQISRVLVDPRNANVVFVAALGHAYGPSEQRGVFRSKNGGESWEQILYRGPTIGAADLALTSDESKILFAVMWEAHRPPWITYGPLEGPGSGLYRSKDGGTTWEQLTGHGLPSGDWGRAAIAVAPGTKGKRVYAAISAKEAGLYRSDDGGNNWERVNGDARITSRAWYFSSITVDPNDPDVVYIPNVAVYKLADGGKTLSIVRGAPGGDDYHQLWIDPANSEHMVLGVDQGTTVTLNGGKTWSTWYNQPTAQFYHVITDNQFPYHVYGAQQDSGTAAIASQTDRNEIDSRDWFTVSGSESGYIAPDPKDANIFYVTGTYGTVVRFDRRTSQSQNIAPSPLSSFSQEMSKRKYRDPWTPVLVFSPAQPSALYLGTQYVMRTRDGGLHWQTISPDLTGAEQAAAAAKHDDPPTVDNAKQRGYGVVYTIAPSPLTASEIWAGSDTGLIHLTRDDGKTWRDVTPPNISAWSKITQIEASHFAPGEAFAAVDRHRLDDMKPYLFRTRDFGRTWDPIVSGFADRAFLNAVREDPKRKGLLYAGTEFGVYVSFDDGDHWQPLQLNLPVTSVRDLTVHDDDLVIATHGRAFWILDDIEPLRQIAENVANSDAWLYKPARAIRMTSDAFWGTPLPPEEPQAQNPPRGAYIDYFIKDASNDPVQLEITDAQGKLVRRFLSTEHPPELPKDLAIAPRWLTRPPQLSGTSGMHRFVWDLRYGRPGEETIADLDEVGFESWIAPFALPGKYHVKLTINGKAFDQPFDVVMDPRSQMTRPDLLEQFKYAQQAFEGMIAAQRAGAEVNGLRIQLDKLKAHLTAAQTQLLSTLTSADDKLRVLQMGGAGENQNGITGLAHAFAVALGAIEGADRVPPSQVIALCAESTQALKQRVSEWESFKRAIVPDLNRQLRDAGIQPLTNTAVRQTGATIPQ